MTERIAVIAGTPADTQMGMECLAEKGIPAVSFPVSASAMEQALFQVSSEENKNQVMMDILQKAEQSGCRKVFVYCNSLSGAVDFDGLAKKTALQIVTPLHVYRGIAGKYRRLGVIAANAMGFGGIEKVLMTVNPELDIMGCGMLPVVKAIEDKMDPEEMVRKFYLKELAGWMESNGMEALILGCTHFPYFKEALQKKIAIRLLDPADEMIRILENDS